MTTRQTIEPLTLTGTRVALVPLDPAHRDDLADAARDGELWRLWYTSVPEPDAMGAEIERRLGLAASGTMLPFTVLDGPGGKPVGMTTYMNIDAVNQRVEIGSTWYARRVQRTGLNTEAKLLLLGHAFETLGCIAVELRTHSMNRQSRRAIEGPRGQARRHPARASMGQGRHAARHLRLQHPARRMAGRSLTTCERSSPASSDHGE